MAERESARLAAVILAAGAGRRFAEQSGGRKLLAPFEGRPLVAGALDAAFGSPARRVLLVTGGDLELAAIARDHARALGREDDLDIVVAARAAEGMGASLGAAVAALSPEIEAVLVFLGDMPRVPAGLAQALLDALTPGFDAAAPRFAGRRGHPVLFGGACFAALRGLSGDVGAREVLASIGERLALIDSPDAGVLFDVDRPQDLA
ncbi:molybdopterin-guanine dinucleotide biosynthesis protein MobA [Caulobacter sp. Root487D2Y]|uniref:nucleotidyltransferase family protein n=1 Tax=Caulobacter sp. Root487D2Y TaxID=1736547 RepID=UPI000700D989|nr:nucleotidyltransferase family protein [Caulobacter sp. Root487D2Y]KQY35086.1 molybdopterin-guanine dinucleotide biosynthesis protein MobA [Caulobacter sp. Root487D2Y]